ncbi:MAG TPA: dihydrolipoyl dehydrogenase, partial [Fibrobacteraceae bacterium]|nr:dihydrolipoyl dehydrogenase [Fibrobacteraceae bacterium]
NWGCIPTKALLRSAEVFQEVSQAGAYGVQVSAPLVDFAAVIARSREVAQANSAGISFLMKKNKVTVLSGKASLLPPGEDSEPRIQLAGAEGEQTITTKFLILATGASPRSLPQWPVDGKRFLHYRQAMSLEQLPKRLLVVGSGAIGLELAWFFNALGSQVTLLETLPRILPAEDAEVSRFLAFSLGKQGIRCLPGAALQSLNVEGDEVHAQIADSKGQPVSVSVDQVLFAVGMAPNTADLGLDDVGVKLDAKGFIEVDAQQRASCPGIWAIGDCVGRQMLAHKASAEAEVAVESLLGHNPSGVDYGQIPTCIYAHPQVASVGLNEARAKELEIPVRLGRFPFQASGKARASGHTEGFVKMLFHAETGHLLGAQILGGDAAEMIAALGVALRQGLTAEQIHTTVFAHPTLSEGIPEAALASLKKAVHL